MSFLLDQNICTAWVRGVPLLASRFSQHQGQLHLSVVTLAWVEIWLLRPQTSSRYLQPFGALTRLLKLVNVDEAIAHRAASIAGTLQLQGQRLRTVDLFVAATALVQGLTLVTHSPQVFAPVAGLTVVDWLVP
jgi:tRNA(fMet)-specific endonuclease VapC